jgi:hypothetical protein
MQCNLTVFGEGDLGNLIWDVTRGQKGLLGYNMEEGFESEAIKIECDPIWAASGIINEFGYQEGLLQAKAQGRFFKYGGADLESVPGSGAGFGSGDTVLGSDGGPD